MCGIAGLIWKSQSSDIGTEMTSMLQALKHRGPDSTGFALYGEGLGTGSWADSLFGWVIPLLGGSEATHNWHNMIMWVMIMFVIIHIYMAVRADIISRESSVSTIIGGWRMFKDDQP